MRIHGLLSTASAGLLALSSAAAAQEVNVYSARHYDTDDQIYSAFTEATGIEVNLIEASADELIQRIEAEGANSPADILITVDAGRLWRAEEAGMFQPVDSEVLNDLIPAHLRHPEGLWFGFSKRARVIIFNEEMGRPDGLETYADLADPAHEGEICIRSSSNIYNQSLLASIIATDGAEAAEEWAAGVRANMARDPEGGDTDQIRAVAAGQCSIGVVNTYYVGRLLASDDEDDRAVGEAVEIIFPNQDGRGTHVNISGAGMAANAPNPEEAVAFLEFLASDEAQELFAMGNNEYPVVESVPVSGPIAGFGTFIEDEINASLLGENNPEAVMIFDRVGWP